MEKQREELETPEHVVFLNNEEELSSGRKAQTESCEPEQSSNSEQRLSPGQSVDVNFETDSGHRDGNLRLNTETPKRESPTQEEGEGSTEHKTVQEEDSLELLEELKAERDEARQLNWQLQTKLAQYFHNRAIDGGQLGRDVPEEEQRRRQYENSIQVLAELRAASEAVQRQAAELRLQAQEKLHMAEEEWEALVAMKRDAAVKTLSRRLGKEAARSKVESVLAAERLNHDHLTKLRLKHFKLRFRIHRLEAELHGGKERGEDLMQVQFDQLQAQLLEKKKRVEREREESLKLQKKISSCLEVLSNVKEKLYWSQAEVQAKRQQLAEVEVTVAKKRDLLTQTKLVRDNLRRDNQRLRERCGLLGNKELLRHFEETVDASEQLEKHLENLKFKNAEMTFRSGMWRQKPEVPFANTFSK